MLGIIKIVKTPDGESPEWLRKSLVGIRLPFVGEDETHFSVSKVVVETALEDNPVALREFNRRFGKYRYVLFRKEACNVEE